MVIRCPQLHQLDRHTPSKILQSTTVNGRSAHTPFQEGQRTPRRTWPPKGSSAGTARTSSATPNRLHPRVHLDYIDSCKQVQFAAKFDQLWRSPHPWSVRDRSNAKIDMASCPGGMRD